MQGTCNDCEHYKPDGTCHLNPPSLIFDVCGRECSDWPDVPANESCGQYEDKTVDQVIGSDADGDVTVNGQTGAEG